MPRVDATKCPKLDRVIKGNVAKETKDADGTAAKLQTLLLDAVAPLVHILEEAQKGTLTPEMASKAAKVALGLINRQCCLTPLQREKKESPQRHEQRCIVIGRGGRHVYRCSPTTVWRGV